MEGSVVSAAPEAHRVYYYRTIIIGLMTKYAVIPRERARR